MKTQSVSLPQMLNGPSRMFWSARFQPQRTDPDKVFVLFPSVIVTRENSLPQTTISTQARAFDSSPHRRRRTRRRPCYANEGIDLSGVFTSSHTPLSARMFFFRADRGKRGAFTITSLKLGPDRKANRKPQWAQGRQINSHRPPTDTFAFELRMIITKGRPQSDKRRDKKKKRAHPLLSRQSIPGWCSADKPLLWRGAILHFSALDLLRNPGLMSTSWLIAISRRSGIRITWLSQEEAPPPAKEDHLWWTQS